MINQSRSGTFYATLNVVRYQIISQYLPKKQRGLYVLSSAGTLSPETTQVIVGQTHPFIIALEKLTHSLVGIRLQADIEKQSHFIAV